MDLQVKCLSTCDVWSVIRFLSAQGKPIVEIHQELIELYGESVMSNQMVRRWRTYFLGGRGNVHDEQRSGRPLMATEGEPVEVVQCMIDADGRLTLDKIMLELPPHIEVSRGRETWNVVKGIHSFAQQR